MKIHFFRPKVLKSPRVTLCDETIEDHVGHTEWLGHVNCKHCLKLLKLKLHSKLGHKPPITKKCEVTPEDLMQKPVQIPLDIVLSEHDILPKSLHKPFIELKLQDFGISYRLMTTARVVVFAATNGFIKFYKDRIHTRHFNPHLGEKPLY
jgi:hypothetical protein